MNIQSRRGAGIYRNILRLAAVGVVGAGLVVLPAEGARAQHHVVSPWDIEAREYLGTPQSEAAVGKALAYLAAHQSADGHWRSGPYESEVGITGLCLLAYLASGNQPGRGRYGATMNQAINFLANSVEMSGAYSTPKGLVRAGAEEHPMYGHGFATLALSEVYGMTHRADLRPKILAAIHLIEDTQNQSGDPITDGGWRYQPMQGDADISVTVVQVMALRAARNAGFKVDQGTLEHAVAYIRRCQNVPNGGFSYQIPMHMAAPPRSAAATLSLLMAGLRDTPECRNGLFYMTNYPLDQGGRWPLIQHFYYGIYYWTQAAYQAGGDLWRRWYPAVRDRLVSMQNPDGGWSERDPYSEAGSEYAAAMGVLVLQVPAGLLPIYQK
jgi:hypothetical protein